MQSQGYLNGEARDRRVGSRRQKSQKQADGIKWPFLALKMERDSEPKNVRSL